MAELKRKLASYAPLRTHVCTASTASTAVGVGGGVVPRLATQAQEALAMFWLGRSPAAKRLLTTFVREDEQAMVKAAMARQPQLMPVDLEVASAGSEGAAAEAASAEADNTVTLRVARNQRGTVVVDWAGHLQCKGDAWRLDENVLADNGYLLLWLLLYETANDFLSTTPPQPTNLATTLAAIVHFHILLAVKQTPSVVASIASGGVAATTEAASQGSLRERLAAKAQQRKRLSPPGAPWSTPPSPAAIQTVERLLAADAQLSQLSWTVAWDSATTDATNYFEPAPATATFALRAAFRVAAFVQLLVASLSASHLGRPTPTVLDLALLDRLRTSIVDTAHAFATERAAAAEAALLSSAAKPPASKPAVKRATKKRPAKPRPHCTTTPPPPPSELCRPLASYRLRTRELAPSVTALVNLLCAQLEYYFSACNLRTDYYLVSIMDSAGFVELARLASFSRVARLLSQLMYWDVHLLAIAVRRSTQLDLHASATRVRPMRFTGLVAFFSRTPAGGLISLR